MSSLVQDSSSRTWWFSSKMSRPPKDIHRSYAQRQPSKPSVGFKFNTFASVLGFKPKKHPGLAIQEPPPLPAQQVQPTQVNKPHDIKPPSSTPRRPPSTSVSTLRSSSEPRTPSDILRAPRCRQSILTLSDSDPFASQGIRLSVVPLDFSQSNHLSNLPSPEFSTKADSLSSFDRASYLSQSPTTDSWWHNTFASTTSLPERHVFSGVEGNTTDELNSVPPEPDSPHGTPLARLRTISQSGSSSTLRRMSSAPLPESPKISETALRSRSSAGDRPSTQGSILPAKSSSISPSLRPSVLRQKSWSRVSQPPTAPPPHHPPLPPNHPSSSEDVIPPDTATPPSSVISFAASHSSDDEVELDPPSRSRYKETKAKNQAPSDRDGDRSPLPKTSLSTPFLLQPTESCRTVKKATSHQSFSSGRGSITSPGSVSSIISDDGPDRQPQKQRPFHHSRLPQQHRNANSQNTPTFATAASNMDQSENLDKRRTNTAGSTSSGRLRLFAGSSLRRPSTQGDTPDDARSQFSFLLDVERKQGVTSPSLYTLEVDDPDPPPSAKSEYVPQQILSPAEMLKVEASVRDGIDNLKPARQRDCSISISSISSPLSPQPSESFGGYSFPEVVEAPPSFVDQSPSSSPVTSENPLPIRSASVGSKAWSGRRRSVRSSTSPLAYSPPSSPAPRQLVQSTPASPQSISLSLPPPPRPRTRPSADALPPSRSSVISLTPLSPPPLRSKARSNPSLESTMLRRALLKKPSFLDIEDEADIKPPDDSFLDLNRDSFDTVRSYTGPTERDI